MASEGVEHISSMIVCEDQTLTGSYATALTGGDESDGIFDISGISQITVYREYTPGSGEADNTLDLQIETSVNNGITWHQEGLINTATASASTDDPITFVSDATSAGSTFEGVPIRMPVDATSMRIRIKETGIASNAGTTTIRFVPRYV